MNGRLFCLWLVACLLAAGLALPVSQADEHHTPAGRSLHAALDELRESGLKLVYSTALVTDGMRVLREPDSRNPVERAREILTPHGLALKEADGFYLVVRPPGITKRGETGSILVHVRNYDGLSAPGTLTTRTRWVRPRGSATGTRSG